MSLTDINEIKLLLARHGFVRLFTGNARHEEERFYFGTRNLVADMLLAHGIHGIDDVYGKLLAYCYQNC